MGYCYTVYLLSQNCVLWILIVLLEDRIVYFLGGKLHNITMLWAFPQANKKTKQQIHKINQPKNTETSQQIKESTLFSFLKSDLHHFNIIHFKYLLQLILCTIRKGNSKKSTHLGKKCKENSTDKTFSRDTGHSLLRIHCFWLGTVQQNLFDWLIYSPGLKTSRTTVARLYWSSVTTLNIPYRVEIEWFISC